MSKDGNLRQLFRSNLPTFFWSSIESLTENGIPDSYFCRGGVSGWVEFKKADANKIASLTAEQVSWHAAHARKGGRSFFFVRRRRELHAFEGTAGGLLLERGLAGPPPLGSWAQPWDWAQIGLILLS